jgi:hypothetical protein
VVCLRIFGVRFFRAADLHLDRLTVVHAGVDEYPLGERIRAVPLVKLLEMSPRL